MIESLFWGAVLRFAQALIQSAPTVLVGLFVAGVFRRLLGQEGTRRLFGAGTWRELPQAWALGMVLPVCSLGVIPVALEMRRARIAGGTVLAFAMTAPLFNPLSLLYGLTLSEPRVILVFSFCSGIVVTVVGTVWDRLFPGSAVEEASPPPVSFGMRRMASILVVAAREITGPSLGYILAGLLGVGLLSTLLPPGSLQSTMEHANKYAPLSMAAVAIPAYATPMVAMSQLGSMFQHANSVGAAFVLLTLGAGLNVGLVAWMFVHYGAKRASAWMVVLLSVVLSIAYAIEGPLHPTEIEPPGHTHAFDIYCRPFENAQAGLPAAVLAKLKENIQPFEVVGLWLLGALFVTGLGLKALDRRVRVETWLERPMSRSGPVRPRLDLVVPGPVLGGVALAVLVALSLVGCYAYYPAPSEIFEEMRVLRGEVLTAAISGNKAHATHFIPIWDDWTRRLQVGAFLREGPISPYRRVKAKVFRDRLELLKHAVEEGDKEESREFSMAADRAYRRMRTVYLKE